MADKTLIEWARHPVTGLGATWNIVTGCSVVSPGCTNCYAMKLAGTRLRNHPSRKGLTTHSKAGPVWNGKVRFNEAWLTQPLGWTKGRGIFVAAHGDLFADGVTDDQIDRIFAVMALTPQHVYFVLTKRPERMRSYLANQPRARRRWEDVMRLEFLVDNAHPHIVLKNVWLGVSVEDQTRANERIPILLDTPAAIRFISAEPLLGPIDLRCLPQPNGGFGPFWIDALKADAGGWFDNNLKPTSEDAFISTQLASLDWVIAGGESGPGARPTHPKWIEQLRDQCSAAEIAFFFKQWGAAMPVYGANRSPLTADVYDGPIMDGVGFAFVGKKCAGNHLEGVQHLEFPKVPS